LGVVLYEQGNFPAALTAFQNIETVNDELALLIHYNQGNTLARIGKIEESENPQEALDHYLKSVAAYKRVLSIEPGHKESAYNIEVVRTWIRDLAEKIAQTSAADRSSRSSPEDHNRQKGKTSPGERNEKPKAGKQEQDDEGDTFPQQPPAAPSIPQDERAVPRNETAQSILREEQQRREAEAQFRGGLSEDERPTW
jgi:tetratricopeptide (TPR) repeat protein